MCVNMVLRALLIFMLFSKYSVTEITTAHSAHPETLSGAREAHPGAGKTLIISADESAHHHRSRRDLHKEPPTNVSIKPTIKHLNDTHKQLMVHWVGEGSNVIICLARDHAPVFTNQQMNPSAVYISYDYGDTYENKTENFRLANGSYSTVEKFYNHPKYNTHFVFTDLRNNLIFTTKNHGRDIVRVNVSFVPHEISFHELRPQTFVVLDKTDARRQLWVTEDFGGTWRVLQEYVKSFFWLQDEHGNQQLIVQRSEPTNLSIILYSSTLFKTKVSNIYATDVKDFYMKGDYLFFTKKASKNNYDLYASYKLGKPLPCIFDTELDRKSYHIADVTGNRALIAISHTGTLSHLYVSENLGGTDGKIRFTLSLESVLCYFPNGTWKDSWLNHVAEEAFADVYKVEGVSGIYIASQVNTKLTPLILGPQHLVSRISFDHGGSWHPINVPLRDNEGQPISCSPSNNCSLNLSQRFSQLYPDSRSNSIVSSKSAPGIIIATGVIGTSLKGHFAVYISTDAGFTWRQALKDLYFFNMGDHGGVLAAVKYFKSRGETKEVLYSTDEGESWTKQAFFKEDIKLYGLMTEPGENTTIFTMFGSAPEAHQWIIVKIDLRSVFKYNCTADDYKPWSPSQDDDNRLYVPCVMGQQQTYQRRIPHANCYNGLDYTVKMSMEPCECDALDYECDFGFIRTGKPWHCIRNKTTLIDPYEVPKPCDPGKYYKRTKGYRKIPGDICVGGFSQHYLPDTIPCPFKEAPAFLLFAQRERIARFNLETKEVEPLPIPNLKNVIAIDFDMRNNCVYWADIVTDTISRQCLDTGNVPEILVSADLASIEGMALDWMSNTLYFVDGMKAKIEMIKTDYAHAGRMRRTILSNDKLTKPRGIAVHPQAGYLFWTDWGSENPSVNRANLDGTEVKVLFKRPQVEWPNGITIDRIAERIYWVDARQDYIASSDLQGQRFKKIMDKNNFVSHPFAIAVFKDTMYWDDWKENAIFSADKDHGVAINVLVNQLSGLMDVKVFAHSVQDGENGCKNSTCPYLCVGAPKQKYSCLCPDGMISNNGKCLCPGNIEPNPNMTCPQIASTCNSNFFSCQNGVCVPKGWRCDGENDCGDGSDELHCGTQTCAANFFVCESDGKCIPQYWRCDHENDCSDKSDEKDCPRQNCTQNQFPCENGRCIAKHWKCDGENDCRDGSDERNCFDSEPVKCKDDEFSCTNGAMTCIPATWRCDGETDCADHSDEINCANTTCPDFQFSCGPPTYRCLYDNWVCDGDNDCGNGRDETNCSTTFTTIPPLIPLFPKANGSSCHDWMFTCDNKNCIPYWWKCDKVDDCGDNSDEVGCGPVPTITVPTTPPTGHKCKQNQYQCKTGECINEAWVCDGSRDCQGGEDESHCQNSHQCGGNEFKCRMDGSCILLKDVCNDHLDCPDGSDEAHCATRETPSQTPATPSCSIGFFPCDDICHPLAMMCDLKRDCQDGFDEANCSSVTRIYQVLQMGVDERGITDSGLLLYWWGPMPDKNKLEFLPSICEVGTTSWKNQTWTEYYQYSFKNLKPYTKYNMTVYARMKESDVVFPPAKYYTSTTGEGVPSEPLNITVQQRNGSHILVSWDHPKHPNGQIQFYEICWYPPLPPIKLCLSDNTTAHVLTADFQDKTTYSFYVIAHNKAHESNTSAVKNITFDGESDVEAVRSLVVKVHTNTTIGLSWKYPKKVDGYIVSISAKFPYPKLQPVTTTTTNITIEKLAPGVHYSFYVQAFRKSIKGPEVRISASTDGPALPSVSLISTEIIKNVAPTIRLIWEKPEDSRKLKWTYGIYYGLTEEDLQEKSRLNTTELSATIPNLDACEKYIFSVGVIEPAGVGPLSQYRTVTTHYNVLAPPKRLTVGKDPQDDMKMLVQWSASCPIMDEPVGYEVFVHELTTNTQSSHGIKKTKDVELSFSFSITHGGVYDVKVATLELNSSFTPSVRYTAPVINPPVEFTVSPTYNGSYILNWKESSLPESVGLWDYQVLVSEGNVIDSKTAQRFTVKKPPFIYNSTNNGSSYTFAVLVRTKAGYVSDMSETSSVSIPLTSSEIIQGITNGTTALYISIGVLIVALVVALSVLYVRHRRLQNSFTRFTNSHYNTRSGAATFEDNGLEEEETPPQIRGFSDDEPLVIA